jgi:hypothetical protein
VAINRLLARVGQSMESQRRFVADAAHELRSPLTACRCKRNGWRKNVRLGARTTDGLAPRDRARPKPAGSTLDLGQGTVGHRPPKSPYPSRASTAACWKTSCRWPRPSTSTSVSKARKTPKCGQASWT